MTFQDHFSRDSADTRGTALVIQGRSSSGLRRRRTRGGSPGTARRETVRQRSDLLNASIVSSRRTPVRISCARPSRTRASSTGRRAADASGLLASQRRPGDLRAGTALAAARRRSSPRHAASFVPMASSPSGATTSRWSAMPSSTLPSVTFTTRSSARSGRPSGNWCSIAFEISTSRFRELAAPPLEMTCAWSLHDFAQYLGTQSATGRYRQAHGTDPVPAFAASRRLGVGRSRSRSDCDFPLVHTRRTGLNTRRSSRHWSQPSSPPRNKSTKIFVDIYEASRRHSTALCTRNS